MSRFFLPCCLTALISIFILGGCPHAEASDCPAYFEPQIIITPIYPPPRNDNSASLQQIRLLSEQFGAGSSASYQTPVGLTAASFRIDSSFAITSRTIPIEKKACSQISHFNLRFGFDDTTVYVAREIPRNSCGYSIVLKHESKHVAADKLFLDRHMIRLHDLMAGVMRRIGVLRTDSSSIAEERFHDVINEYLRELASTMANERQYMQREIDTVEEYSNMSQACGGEISLLAMGAGGD